MRDGLCLLKEHRLAEGARVFRGAGCGLTPGGDDFLSGFLLGLNVAERICGDNLEDARIEIYRNSVGENAISNATLACSRDGRLTERFRDLVFSMVHCSGAEVRGNAGRLFEMGATSGADAAAGFYVATVLYLRPLNHVGPGFSPDSEHLGRHSGLTPSHITAEEPSGLQPGPTRYFETL